MTNPTEPNRRQTAKSATREKVLAAARRLFLTVGYEAATIRDVARAAGMSTGAVFANVADKTQLWREAMGGPAPSAEIGLEIALVLAQRPGWGWSIGTPQWTASDAQTSGAFTAALRTPDFDPGKGRGRVFAGAGDSPAAALRQARLGADDAMPLTPSRPALKAVA